MSSLDGAEDLARHAANSDWASGPSAGVRDGGDFRRRSCGRDAEEEERRRFLDGRSGSASIGNRCWSKNVGNVRALMHE